MEEKKVSKTSKTTSEASTKSTSKAASKPATKTTSSKTTAKTTTSKTTTRKSTPRKKKVDEIEDIEEIEKIEEDDDVTEQIKRRRKVDEKSFNTGLSLGAKIAIVIVIAVIIILLLLKGCKNKSEYTIKFNSNGGTEVSEQVISADGKVSVPKDPTKEGYTFVGWYVDGKRYDFDSKVTSDLVIEAKWDSSGNAEVTGVTIDQKEVAILPGDTIPLVATVEPSDARDKSVTWSSDDESVVTVDDEGKITAKSVGSATITVTTNDKKYTAECRVVVSDNVVKVTGITLSTTKLTLAVGDAERVEATVTPNNATNKGVTWSSSDSSVASVSSTGVIRAVSDGEATITASTKDGDHKDTVKVKVEKISVESLKVENLTVGIGKTAELSYKVLPANAADKTVTWKSTDTSIATVDNNGKVTGVEAGTVTIIGTTKDGEKKGTAKVTVTKPVAVTGVSFKGCPGSLEVGQSATLTVNVSPSNAVNKQYKWDTSKTNGVITISNGKIVAKKEGTAKVSVTTSDGGFTATCDVTVVKASEKASDYTISLEGIKQEGTGTIMQYNVSVTKKGKKVNFNKVIYAGNPIFNGDTLDANDLTGAKSATLFLETGEKLDGVNVTVK